MIKEKLITGVITQRTFSLEKELTHGGFGTVYLAHEAGNPMEYALKLPRPLGNSLKTRTLIREAAIQKSFSHPHITPIEVYDVFIRSRKSHKETIPFHVTPLADANLEEKVLAESLPIPQALSISEQIGSALMHIHSKGIIHGDTRPMNVLLRKLRSGLYSAEITDFGGATWTDPEKYDTDAIVVNELYSAPEAFSLTVTPATDQWGWASGVVYPAFTRQAPYDEDHLPINPKFGYNYIQPRSFEEIIGAKRMTTLHDAVEQVVNRAMQPNIIQRYESMAALLDDLGEQVAKAKEKTERDKRLIT